jgi:uncharacterized membrane protein YhaH (DUF805 family)
LIFFQKSARIKTGVNDFGGYCMELLKSLFTVDEPIGRATYAAKVFSFLVFCAIFVAFLNDIEPKMQATWFKVVIVGLLVLLLVAFVIFFTVTIIKRYWDVIGDKKNAIIWGLCTIFVAPFIPFIGDVASLIAFIVLFFIPGQEA